MKHKIKNITPYGYKQNNLFIQVERNGLEFEPGMCCEIFDRVYSFAGSKYNEDTLEFLVKIMPNGHAGEQFSKLRPLDEIEIGEVFGFFSPGKDCKHKEYMYIATGTGIAPFRSALLTYKNHSPQYFLFGGKYISDWFDLAIIINDQHPNTYMFGAQSVVDDPSLEIPKHITHHAKTIIPSIKNKQYNFYLCGLDRMISDISNIIIDNNFTYDQIQTEQFYSKI